MVVALCQQNEKDMNTLQMNFSTYKEFANFYNGFAKLIKDKKITCCAEISISHKNMKGNLKAYSFSEMLETNVNVYHYSFYEVGLSESKKGKHYDTIKPSAKNITHIFATITVEE